MEPSSCQSSQCESIASNLRARIATTENEVDYWKGIAEKLRAPFAHVDSLDWDYLERLLIVSMRHQQDSQTRIWIEAIKAARAALNIQQRAEK